MKITGFAIDGFGILSNLRISNLSPGMNVLHGTNGSGKTTILHFLRGVFCGFEEARQLTLLPSLKGGNPGGGVSVAWNDGQYDVIRQVRSDRSDLLAINMRRGDITGVAALRSHIHGVDRLRVHTVFAVNNLESAGLAAMIRIALRDGIELKSGQRSTEWLCSRITRVQQERAQLFQQEPASRGQIAELERRKAQIDQDVHKISRDQQARHERWVAAVHRLKHEIERLQREIDWLRTEQGAAQADLTEVQDRLWSTRNEIVREPVVIEIAGNPEASSSSVEIHEIDDQMERARQMLRDIATSRMKISIENSRLAGLEAAGLESSFARHRASIEALESEAGRLDQLQNKLQTALKAKECLCGDLSTSIKTSVEALRLHLYTICQELCRQQASHAHELLGAQRDSVDRCELELVRQIHQLRARRDQLQRDWGCCETGWPEHRSQHESAYCTCQCHREYRPSPGTARGGSPATREVDYVDRVVVHSQARPDDAEREPQLIDRIGQLQRQCLEAMSRLRDARQQLQHLEQEQSDFAEDLTLPKRRYEYVVIEQQLADAREQWQSLALLQRVLQATHSALKTEQPSVVIEEASRLFKRVTEGRYTGFWFDDHLNELRIQCEGNRQLPISALSRGTLDQASLCFRLALCAEYARRGFSFPLVLDDVLADSDESRLAASASVLMEYAQAGQQIIFLTCQDRLAARLAALSVPVQYLSGRPEKLETPHARSATLSADVEYSHGPVDRQKPVVAPTEDALMDDKPVHRVQPASPYWLEVNSSLSYLPSMSTQMARRLGALGVRDLGDLIDLNPDSTEVPLHGLQVSAEQLRHWQGEGRLLCCIPDLNGRDAQLLVAAGYYLPSEVAQADLSELISRVSCVRRERAGEHAFAWLADQTDEPDRERASCWIHAARRARSLSAARRWSNDRRPQGLVERRRRRRSERRRNTANGRQSGSATVRTAAVRRRSRTTPIAGQAQSVESKVSGGSVAGTSRHFLESGSAIVHAPSIGPKTASRLEQIGVRTVSELLLASPEDIAARLQVRHITESIVRGWQQQSLLMCSVPNLRGHDAQLLVACGIERPEQMAAFAPQQLLDLVGPFSLTKEGQRILRSSAAPDLDEVTQWITLAGQATDARAA